MGDWGRAGRPGREAVAVVGTLIVVMTLTVAGIARTITARLGFSAPTAERPA